MLQMLQVENLSRKPNMTLDSLTCDIFTWTFRISPTNHRLISPCRHGRRGMFSWHPVNQSGWGNLSPELQQEASPPSVTHWDFITTLIQQGELQHLARWGAFLDWSWKFNTSLLNWCFQLLLISDNKLTLLHLWQKFITCILSTPEV